MSDLKDFQSEVFRNYESLARRSRDITLFEEKGPAAFIKNPNHGIARKSLLKALGIFKIKFEKFYVKSKPFAARERTAEEIIENPKIKRIICGSLQKKISPDFFKEEVEIEVILTVTALLTKQALVKEFSIERNELLFSMMTYKILAKGVENYCAG